MSTFLFVLNWNKIYGRRNISRRVRAQGLIVYYLQSPQQRVSQAAVDVLTGRQNTHVYVAVEASA